MFPSDTTAASLLHLKFHCGLMFVVAKLDSDKPDYTGGIQNTETCKNKLHQRLFSFKKELWNSPLTLLAPVAC